MSFVNFKNVTKKYHMGSQEIVANNNVNFDINEGEFCVIVGPSGAGKTTILNLLGGMEVADMGEILVGGLEITKLNERELTNYRRFDVGFVFQFYNLMPNLTALENLEIAVEICKNPLSPMDVLKQVGLEDRMNNFPSQLSGGEQQRVCIARAIVNEPKLLICDEPTGNLDPETSKEIMSVIESINKDLKTTVIMATHDKDIVNRMKKRVLLIEHGVLTGDYLKGRYKSHESV